MFLNTVLTVVGVGCATTERTAYTVLPIHTTPSGATVQTNGVYAGITPTTLSLPRLIGNKQPLKVSLTLTGYRPLETNVFSKVSWEGFWYVLPGLPAKAFLGLPPGPPGVGLDLEPRSLQVTLQPLR